MTRIRNDYSLRQVVELTGATEFLLRAWELRYSALKPKRTDTGRRRYSADDVKRLRLLLDLTQHGFKISEVAELSLAALEKKWSELQPGQEGAATDQKIEHIFGFADRFDWAGFAHSLDRAERDLGPAPFILDFVAPLLSEMGRRVGLARFSISQEHIVSGLLRQKMASIPAAAKKRKEKRLVFASPEGDFHDLGLWLGQSLAKARGFETLFLGANMPKRDLSETCVRYAPTHLVLTSTVSRREGAKEEFLQVLSFLDRHLPSSVALWVAGRNTRDLPARLGRPFRVFSSFTDFWEELA